MNIFATADEHHGHRNVIRFCNRPFSGVEEMTEKLIENNNKIVKPGDLVYHIGDMFWRTFGLKQALQTMDRLNGQHFYVLGNHEELIEESRLLQSQFIWVKERAKIRPPFMPRGIVLDHFAGRVWNGSHDGSWQLYGHTHGDLEEEQFLLSCDVGVDSWNYAPAPLEEIALKMEAKMPAYEARKLHFERIKDERNGAMSVSAR